MTIKERKQAIISDLENRYFDERGKYPCIYFLEKLSLLKLTEVVLISRLPGYDLEDAFNVACLGPKSFTASILRRDGYSYTVLGA